jgi:hypothetical protein
MLYEPKIPNIGANNSARNPFRGGGNSKKQANPFGPEKIIGKKRPLVEIKDRMLKPPEIPDK